MRVRKIKVATATRTAKEQVDYAFRRLAKESRATTRLVQNYAQPKGLFARLGLRTHTP